jgi:two-component system, sporulation sensor kinase E
MRLAIKGVLLLLVLYLIFLGGMGVWVGYSLQSVSNRLIKNTARIIGREVASAMAKSAVEDLIQGDPAARARLEQLVGDVSEHSEVVESIAVVDEAGKVAASDDLEVGRQLVVPEIIFRREGQVEFANSKLMLQSGQYHLFVPLLDQSRLLGYLRLSINSQPLAKLYYRARREFALAALIGMLGIGSLGLLLHAQLTQRGAALTRALERAIGGEEVLLAEGRDEFAPAVAVARKVGTQLSEARERSTQATRRLGALAKVMDVGVLLLAADLSLDFANVPARELLGCSEAGALELRWDELRALLAPALSARGRASSAYVELEVPGTSQAARLRLEVNELKDEGSEGFLVVVKSREMIDALENELGLAIQMRGLTRFYMGVVHDLKTPLQAMVMNIELLKETLAGNAESVDERTRQRQARYMDVLRDEVSRLDRQLRALLVHTVPTSEPQQVIDVGDLVRELVMLVGPQAKQQRVAVESALPEGPVPFTGHADRLKQALLNIAMNALEAMPDGGRLAVQLENGDGQIRISLRDSGPGISPELQSQIYKMHFTTKSGGTGIGLYVARSVVESHGGEIQVETAAGRGTCFQIYLPLAAPRA